MDVHEHDETNRDKNSSLVSSFLLIPGYFDTVLPAGPFDNKPILPLNLKM